MCLESAPRECSEKYSEFAPEQLITPYASDGSTLLEDSWAQYNLTLPRDVGAEFLALLAKIAEDAGLAKPEKVNKRWENVTDPLALIIKICKPLSGDVWRGI